MQYNLHLSMTCMMVTGTIMICKQLESITLDRIPLGIRIQTASGPKTLLIRGSGPVDGYKPTREFWHGSLNEDRLVIFNEEDDPAGIKAREEIDAYLIEMESIPIKTASEFDSFLMNEVQILKKPEKRI